LSSFAGLFCHIPVGVTVVLVDEEHGIKAEIIQITTMRREVK
jgi:hypothetical protein